MRRRRVLAAWSVAIAAVAIVLPVAGAAGAVTAQPAVGTTWTLQALPGVPAGLYPEDLTVDCPSVGFCAMTSDLSYASTLNGSSVHTVNVAALGPDPNDNYAVTHTACSTPGTCVASGEFDQGPCCGSASYRVDLTGTTWSVSEERDQPRRVARRRLQPDRVRRCRYCGRGGRHTRDR